jgi:dTDP-4-dehydrorhamnose 3,5-epimerase
MGITITETNLPGVLLIHPQIFADERGFFLETHQQKKYADAGLDITFVQDNHSHSRKNVLRGLHYQLKHPQGKLVQVISGEIFDVAVDLRQDSPTFRRWTGVTMSAHDHKQLYIPPGFAHGFWVVSDEADVLYKCTDFYYSDDDYGIVWNDPAVGIR